MQRFEALANHPECKVDAVAFERLVATSGSITTTREELTRATWLPELTSPVGGALPFLFAPPAGTEPKGRQTESRFTLWMVYPLG